MAIYEPKINTVTLLPNPVNINKSFTISVSVSEIEVIMYAVSRISGTFKSGESIVLTTHKEVS